MNGNPIATLKKGETMLPIYLIIFIALVLIIAFVINLIKQQQTIKEQAQGLMSGYLEMVPGDFLEMRNASFGGRGNPKYANNFNFTGVYIVFNHTKNLYYIGQGQKVFDRINSLFIGKGNSDVYYDYKRGDQFTIKTLSLRGSGFTSLDSLKKHTIDKYTNHSKSYSNKKIQAKMPENIKENIPVFKPAYSVTSRIKSIKQPYGGYIRPSSFVKTEFNDDITLFEENLHVSTMGLVVDYLTRYSLGASPEKAFHISILGAKVVEEETAAIALLNNIDGLTDLSITSACQLCGFDVAFRAGKVWYTKKYYEINPDDKTISNIRTMVNRSISFFEKYGPITCDGFTFQGGYTATVTSGDGDFLTADTLWDFKVSYQAPKSAHTLQLLMYYIMGCHSIHQEFKQIEYLGIFNPRLNCVYRFKLSELSQDIISEVETDIIGYETSKKL